MVPPRVPLGRAHGPSGPSRCSGICRICSQGVNLVKLEGLRDTPGGLAKWPPLPPEALLVGNGAMGGLIFPHGEVRAAAGWGSRALMYNWSSILYHA